MFLPVRRVSWTLVLIVVVGFGFVWAAPVSWAQSPTVSSLSPPTRTITQGGTSTLTLTINAAQPTETVVTVTSSAPGIAHVPSQVTVPAGSTSAVLSVTANTPGTAQIVVSLNEVNATSTVIVTPAQPTVVSLLPPTNPVLLGATTTLTVTLSAAQPMDTVIKVTEVPSGLVTGPPTVTVPAGDTSAPVPITAVGLGTAMVRARLNESVAEAIVRVTAPAPALVALQPTPLSLASDASSQLAVTLNAVQATETTVTLAVDKSSVLQVSANVVVPAGQLQAAFSVTGRAAGDAMVTATVGDSSQKATVQVRAAAPVVVSVVPNPFLLQQAATGSVIVTLNAAQPTDTVVALTNSAPTLLQAPRSVTVPAGRTSAEFAVTGLAPGDAVISAAATGAAVSATVQVSQPLPKVTALTPTAVTLSSGTPGVLLVSVSPAPTEPTPVSLTSSTPTVAEVPLTVTIPAGSLGAEFPVATRRPGETTITATVNGGMASALVTVTAAEFMSLTLAPAVSSVGVGESQAFRAIGTLTDGTTQDLTSRVTWGALDQTVATISSNGVATGLASGTTTMTAAAGSLTARATLTVATQTGRLGLTPATATLGVGQSLPFTVSLAAPGTEAVTVTLTTIGTGNLTVSPTSVVIPAGQSGAPFNVTGTSAGTVTLTASAQGLAPASSVVTISAASGPPGRSLTGRVLAATDAKSLAAVRLTLAGQSATTDANGQFVFTSPPSGYQLVKIDPLSLEPYRQRLKDGSLGGLMHADPVLVNISSEQANQLRDPIWVVQTHPTLYPIVPGQSADIRPTHIPGFTLMIPAGTTIRGEDGQPNSGVAITALPPDRVPRIPENAAPRTVYLVTFERHGGGFPTKPIPIILPNDLGGEPGAKVQLWFYEKSPAPDPQSHQWKFFGRGTVSPDGTRILPDPGVGQPQFCYLYPTLESATDTVSMSPGDEPNRSAGEPVDVSSGVFVYQKTDLVLPGVLPVTITRTYRTRTSGIGPFGQGGSFNYHLFAKTVGQTISLQMPDVNRYIFTQEGDGKYRNQALPLWKGAAITTFGDGHYELRLRDGMTWVFNTAGWLTAQRDRYNNQITINRDGNNLITSVSNPAGQTLTFTYTTVRRGHDFFSVIASITDPLGRVVQYGYNAFHNGRLSSVTDPEGGVTLYTYGDLSPEPYYWNEGLQTITDPRGLVYLKNEYDNPSGRLIRQVLADGSTYTFAYTLAGQTITQTAVTDPRGNVTTYSFNSAQYTSQVTAAGQLTQYQRQTGTNALTSVTDALNRVTTYTYDTNGNVASIQDPEGNLTQFQYESTFSRLTQITDALTPANITTFAYDDVNRTTTITDPEGKQTVIQYNTAGQPTSITDPLTHVTSYTYDAQGNLTTTTDALGNTTTRFYDAVSRLTALSDPRGMLTRFTYDDLNRVTQIQDALGGLTSFTYDPNGNLLSVTDAKNQTTTYTYDEMDRLLTRKDALNRTESYEYDKAGNFTKFTDRKNQASSFTYDSLNRRTSASYPDATVSFGYDAIGRLTTVSDSVGGNITWVYDVVGQHPQVQETTTAGTVTVESDEIGRRLKLSATGQTDVTYTYDKNSRLKTVTQGSQTVTLAYDDAGRRTSLTYPNGVVTSYGYDNANRLQTMAHVKTPTTIESLTYQSDAAGNRISLTRANAAATLLPQAMTAEYDAANEQFKFNSSTPNLVYDGNGNLSSFTDGTGTTTYTWNARNQLVSITAPSLTASFVYDGLGWRTSKTINSVTTGYWYDGQDLLAELSGSTPTVTYVRSLNVDEPFIRQLTGGNEYYQTDALGSTVALSNAAGASVVSYSYEPFGKTTVTGTSSNPFQFTGRENDSTGLYYYRARYYSNTSMRFINEDPINFAGGDPNLYAYVSNNPVQWLDPYGLYKIFVCLDTNILTVVNDDGQGAYQTGTVTGCNETPTKSGRYRLGAWEDDKTSTKWGWKSSTPWSQWAVGANVFGPYFSAIMNGSGQGLHGSLGPMYNQPIFRWMQRFDCSHGCIRVSNQAINDIHNLIPKIAGTIIDIRAKCIF